jgi:hypothetical protein
VALPVSSGPIALLVGRRKGKEVKITHDRMLDADGYEYIYKKVWSTSTDAGLTLPPESKIIG